MRRKPAPPQPEELLDYQPTLTLAWWQRLWRWVRTGKGMLTVLAAVLVAAALWSSGSIYRAIKHWRAEKLIAQSAEAGRQGRDTEEFRLLREAFILFPDQPLTLRAVAHYHEKRSEATALQLYERLIETHLADTDDKIRACRLALQYGKARLGRKLLEDLRGAAESSQRPAVLALEAQLLAMEGSWDAAIAKARLAVGQPGDRAAERLLLATILLRAADRAAGAPRSPLGAEAIDLFADAAKRTDEFGVEAISALVGVARMPVAYALFSGRDVTAWVDAAAAHPMAPPRLRVAAWDLHVAARTPPPEQLFPAFVARWRGAEATEQLEAARWLIQRGQPVASLELSTAQREASADWFFVYLDALAATRQWKEVLAGLGKKSGQAATMSGAVRALFAMRARTELKLAVDADESWRDIQILTQNETVQNRLYVAKYAETMGQTAQAAAIYRRLVELPPGEAIFGHALSKEEKMTCYTALIRTTPETAPAAEMLPTMDSLSREFPELDEARNDAIYLRLLTGDVTAPMKADLSRFLERYPALMAYRTTAALYRLRSRDAAGAAQLYEGWEIDWSTAPDRYRVVRIATLEANGRAAESEPLRAMIDRARLRPEEKALLGK